MTNLEALIKANGWNGGTFSQFDILYHKALDRAGIDSICSLCSLDEWLDFVVAAHEVYEGHVYYIIRTAYLLKYKRLADGRSVAV